MVTDSIGPYRILDELGHGGQGTVYLAEDPKLGRRVALKVLTGVRGLSARSVQRFRREAEITAQIDHPGICTTYDFGDADGVPWIAMRHVEGTRLLPRRTPRRLLRARSQARGLARRSRGRCA